jgi:hypothetical protein
VPGSVLTSWLEPLSSPSVSGSVALPQITRRGPSWNMSPSLVTGAKGFRLNRPLLKPIGAVAKNVLVDLGGPLSPV